MLYHVTLRYLAWQEGPRTELAVILAASELKNSWGLVKRFYVSYHNQETLLFTKIPIVVA